MTFPFTSEVYTREEKSSALATLRKNRADNKAWVEDNKKRKQENKPTRTLLQYKTDTDPTPPPQSVKQSQQSTDKTKIFDSRQPQPDSLPKMKIPIAKTGSEYQRIKDEREHIRRLHETGHSTFVTTTVAGAKRAANNQDGNVSKKPKPETAARAGLNRRADKSNSSPATKSGLGSFMDYLRPQTETRPMTGSSSTSGSRPTPKQKTDRQSVGVIERAEAVPATVTAKHIDDKKGGNDTKVEAKAAVKPRAPTIKRKADEAQSRTVKRCKTNPVFSAGEADSKASVAVTSKAVPRIASDSIPKATAKRVDNAGQPENASNQESSAKPVEKPSLATNRKTKTKTNDMHFDRVIYKDIPPVDSTTARTVEEPTVNASPDKSSSSNKPAATKSATATAGTKRKANDEVSNPAKKPKLQAGNPRNSLRNPRQACFMNASLHVFHSIPVFAALKNESSKETKADNVLSQAEMKLALGRGQKRQNEDARAKLRDHLRLKEERNELKLSPHLKQVMMDLSVALDVSQEVDPFLFRQVCGTMFTGDEDNPMNGETQEDAHEFILKVLDRLRKEQPELDIDELLAAQFAERQTCKCGAVKTLTEENSNFNIPDHFQRYRVNFGGLLNWYMLDGRKFDDYRCEKCGKSGRWSTRGGWEGKRVTKAPEYLIANVPRGQLQSKGNRMEEAKLTTRIVPPLKKVSFPSADGSTFHYHLVAMIKHQGQNLHRGHYTTIRKIGNKWWHCDDTAKGGVTPLTRQEVLDHEDGCVFLLKKGGDDESYGRT